MTLFWDFWWATWAIRSWLLIPSEWPEQIAQGHSFVLSDLSNSLTLLRRNERIFFFFKKFQKSCRKCTKNTIFLIFLLNHSFFLSERENEWLAQKSLAIRSFAHLSWVTCGNHSYLLICHERLEQFAHRRSVDLSDLSELLTFAHLCWAILVNEWMSDERMSKFSTL